MKKILAIILLFPAALSCSSKSKIKDGPSTPSQVQSGVNPNASSEIPAKRDFPVNESISPCQDFYGYACSRVNDSFKLREDRSYHDFAFSDSAERLLESKKKFMKELGIETTPSTSKHREELKAVYQACMDEEGSKKEEQFYVDKIIKDMSTIKTKDEFKIFLGKNILSKDTGFVQFDTTANLENPDMYDAVLIAGLQQLPERSYYDNPELMAEFRSIAVDLFKLVSKEKSEERANAVVDFEKAFSQTFPLPAEFRELYNSKREISRQELISKFPNLKFEDLLSKVPSQVHIRNITPENFAFLNKSLDTLPLDTLKDIYLFQVLPEYMDDAYPAFFNRRFEFKHKFLGGPPTRPVREERCTRMVMDNFTKEIDSELLPVLFPHFPTKRVVSLVEKVRASIIEGMRENTWLSDKGRKEAVKKMKVARLQLVKPLNERQWDFTPLANYSSTGRYSNLRTLQLNLLLKKIHDAKKTRDKTRWEMGPLTVNAYYSPSDNKFVMPIGILQYPFFDDHLSDEANLGALGAVAGHELGHGIDDKGSRYDEKGRFREWMSPEDLNEFKKRGEILANQFNALAINGQLTMGENIGDLVGLTSAYRAAFPNNKGTVGDKKAFFLQYARVWCNVIRPKFREMMIKTNPHSPGEARANQPVKNQSGFDEAYECKAGDKMFLAPQDQVKIW